jgi:hypothetical protein
MMTYNNTEGSFVHFFPHVKNFGRVALAGVRVESAQVVDGVDTYLVSGLQDGSHHCFTTVPIA